MTSQNQNTATELSIPKALKHLDDALHALVSNIDILDAVSPLNYRDEKKAFFDGHYSKVPNFVYKKSSIDAFGLKRGLFNLPVEKIQDDDLRQIYLDVIDSYIDKIDQFKSIGTGDFLYDSLRYYGEPSKKDIRNAHFVLHLPETASADELEPTLDANDIEILLGAFADQRGYDYLLKKDDAMIANALVSGTTIKINTSAKVSKTEAMALAHHEVGVHLVTTLNGRAQPLKLLSMGCPLNTMTQEGMAILAEYLAGCLTTKRLKVLALRVLAVDSMLKDKNFRTTFLLLKEQYHVSQEQAFTITARVFRGGGFTKDFLYLQGFHQMLNAYESEANFNYLLAGKTSIDYLPNITKLIERGVLLAPRYIAPAFVEPVDNSDANKFIVHAIK
ncbi:MAG: flavohemoglobin expression-modulating QEGLA motif protein [Oleiphilus sp.]